METATTLGEDVRRATKNFQDELADDARRARDKIKSGLAGSEEIITDFVRAQPIVALSGAFIIGYLVARAVRSLQ